MDIAEVFRGDRGRLVSGTACQTPGNAPDPPQVVPGMEEAMGRFPPAAIVAGPCNDRLATQETEQMDIMSLLRSDRCTVVLPKSSKSPGNSSKNAKDKKKIAALDPFRGKKPGKTLVHGGQSVPEAGPFHAKTATIDIHWRGRGSNRLATLAGIRGKLMASHLEPLNERRRS